MYVSGEIVSWVQSKAGCHYGVFTQLGDNEMKRFRDLKTKTPLRMEYLKWLEGVWMVHAFLRSGLFEGG